MTPKIVKEGTKRLPQGNGKATHIFDSWQKFNKKRKQERLFPPCESLVKTP